MKKTPPLPTALPEDAMIILAGNVSQTLDMSGAGVKDDDAPRYGRSIMRLIFN
jgi:hypothetical protein